MREIQANIQSGKYEDILAAVQSPVIALIELIKNASDSCTNMYDPIVININTDKRLLTITDSGEGITEDELEHLGEAGYSSKMVGNNTRSPINNPLSGSKGLGLLTAFFIADTLEIETYSIKDEKSFYLIWRKGEQKYSYVETDTKISGTTITLKNIELEKLQMILLPEEKIKLFMSSIRFYKNNQNIPPIKLIINGIEESYYPSVSLEKYYSANKRSANGFIAKASFKYSNNCITLSYEDNINNFYTFKDLKIDLKDKNSIDNFIKDIRISEKGAATIRNICNSEAFSKLFIPIETPAFSGVLYTWRGRKPDDIQQWPQGVRIYINNYSLYRYLDKENDWLTLSEISQNYKATNYKLKNSYGYIDITDYNESNEQLKISKERNDFVDSMAQRKFLHIMRDIIIGIFTRIDIAVKNPPVNPFSLKYNNVTIRIGDTFNLANALNIYDIELDNIELEYDESKLCINDNWLLTAKQAGSYEIGLSFSEISYTFKINVKNIVPEFKLQKNMITIFKGNTVNLRDYIIPSSCKDVSPESITITPGNKNTIIKNDLFDKDNSVGQHIVFYRYDDFQQTLWITVNDYERHPGTGAKSPRIDSLFPKLEKLREHSFKIPELIDAISSYYVQAPTLCMAAIRILIESSTKSFFQALVKEEVTGSFSSLVNKVINIRDCNPNSSDYIKYVSTQDSKIITEFHNISNQYQAILSKDVKTNINNHLSIIDLDMFVHNPEINATDITVYKSMQIFAPLLNYIFDILLVLE